MKAGNKIKTYKKEILIGILWGLLSWKASHPDIWNTPIPFDSKLGMTLYSNPLIGPLVLPFEISIVLMVFPRLILEWLGFGTIPVFFIRLTFVILLISTSFFVIFSFSRILRKNWNEIKLRKKWVLIGAAWGVSNWWTTGCFSDWIGGIERDRALEAIYFIQVLPTIISGLFMALPLGLLDMELIDGGPEGIYYSPVL